MSINPTAPIPGANRRHEHLSGPGPGAERVGRGYGDEDTVDTGRRANRGDGRFAGIPPVAMFFLLPFLPFIALAHALGGGRNSEHATQIADGEEGRQGAARTARAPSPDRPRSGAARSIRDRQAGRGPREVTFYNVNTRESSSIRFSDGGLSRNARAQFDAAMYDWRTGESRRMDDRLLNAVYELQRELGAVGNRVSLVSGYRSAATQMAKVEAGTTPSRSLGYHPQGKALDIAIEGVSFERLHAAARRLQQRGIIGGVGGYPSPASGPPYVHIDTGPSRNWGSAVA